MSSHFETRETSDAEIERVNDIADDIFDLLIEEGINESNLLAAILGCLVCKVLDRVDVEHRKMTVDQVREAILEIPMDNGYLPKVQG